jgi:hypothetical protein
VAVGQLLVQKRQGQVENTVQDRHVVVRPVAGIGRGRRVGATRQKAAQGVDERDQVAQLWLLLLAWCCSRAFAAGKTCDSFFMMVFAWGSLWHFLKNSEQSLPTTMPLFSVKPRLKNRNIPSGSKRPPNHVHVFLVEISVKLSTETWGVKFVQKLKSEVLRASFFYLLFYEE